MLRDLTIWRRFQQEITDRDLKAISEANYGYDVEGHFQAIREILSTGVFPVRLAWEPREVLSLVSWENYWEVNRESRERVYFCAVVLLAASEQPLSNSDLEGQVEKMIVAIDTSKLLGDGRTENLYEFFRFLVPRLELEKVEEDYLYFRAFFDAQPTNQ